MDSRAIQRLHIGHVQFRFIAELCTAESARAIEVIARYAISHCPFIQDKCVFARPVRHVGERLSPESWPRVLDVSRRDLHCRERRQQWRDQTGEMTTRS